MEGQTAADTEDASLAAAYVTDDHAAQASPHTEVQVTRLLSWHIPRAIFIALTQDRKPT